MGFDTVGIIHGQVTGVLKKVVREYLKAHRRLYARLTLNKPTWLAMARRLWN
ncbi:MAG: hypothetical protein H2174_06080 [Vampirovibrio sp.]|nr:hypothetical protein [Vampirovibrio sp.]